MFGLFKKKSEKDKLIEDYERLMKESKNLSTVDRKKSDEKFAEATKLLEQIQKMN